MERASSLLEEVKAVAAQLSAAERLAIIRALADSPPVHEGEQAANQSAAERRLLVEEDAWYSRPKADRMRYAGSYVAVVDGSVVDQDLEQRALVLRMRAQPQPALIVFADWDAPPDLVAPSIHRPS